MDKLEKMIHRTEELTKLRRNLKSKILRRKKKLLRPLDPLKAHQIENEIELFKRAVRLLEIEDLKLSLAIIKNTSTLFKEKQEDGFDWRKAGTA